MGLEQESESPQEKAAKEFKISQKANGLFQKYQKLLLEKYDEDGEKVIGYNDKERKLSDEVRDFYYKDCKEIPKIRFEPGDDEHDDGEYEEDGLNAVKILPHNMALYKEVEYDYDRPV